MRACSSTARDSGSMSSSVRRPPRERLAVADPDRDHRAEHVEEDVERVRAGQGGGVLDDLVAERGQRVGRVVQPAHHLRVDVGPDGVARASPRSRSRPGSRRIASVYGSAGCGAHVASPAS